MSKKISSNNSFNCDSWCIDTLCMASLHVWFEIHTVNVLRGLIHESMLYKLELSHNTTEATKNICYVKGKTQLMTITKKFKKFHWGCKNLDDLARLGRPKIMGLKAIHYASGVNLVSLIVYKVSLASHSPVWFITFMNPAKESKLCLTLPKYCKTFDLP